MQQILATFGVDWRLLLINAVNFGVLLAVLWWFMYRPVMALLEARRQKVAQGLADAAAAAAAKIDIEHSRAGVLSEAAREADALLGAARVEGEKKEKELLVRGEAAAASILREAQAQAEEIKAQALQESKQEVAKLIVLGIEKVATK